MLLKMKNIRGQRIFTYLADLSSALLVICTKYEWIIGFSRNHSGYKIIWLNEVAYPLREFSSSYLSKYYYSWEYMLRKSKFEDSLKSIVADK